MVKELLNTLFVRTAYQTRKQEEVTHPFLKTSTPLGLVPHLQGRLLARFSPVRRITRPHCGKSPCHHTGGGGRLSPPSFAHRSCDGTAWDSGCALQGLVGM